MKITTTLLMLLVLFLPRASPQNNTQWDLPEGAVACLGKGTVWEILYSPNGARLAVVSSIGIWLYDTTTSQVENSWNGEIAVIARHLGWGSNVTFSPDSGTFASWGAGKTVRL